MAPRTSTLQSLVSHRSSQVIRCTVSSRDISATISTIDCGTATAACFTKYEDGAELTAEAGVGAKKVVRVGLRKVEAVVDAVTGGGRKFVVNGQKVFLEGPLLP